MANVSRARKSTSAVKAEAVEANNRRLDAERLIALLDEQYKEIQQDALREMLRCATMDLPAIQAKLKACQAFKDKLITVVNASAIADKKLDKAIKGDN